MTWKDHGVSHVEQGQLNSEINTVDILSSRCLYSFRKSRCATQKRPKSLYTVYRNPDIILLKRVNFEPLELSAYTVDARLLDPKSYAGLLFSFLNMEEAESNRKLLHQKSQWSLWFKN